jgi:hypothetical protein
MAALPFVPPKPHHQRPILCYNALAIMDSEWVARAAILAEIVSWG